MRDDHQSAIHVIGSLDDTTVNESTAGASWEASDAKCNNTSVAERAQGSRVTRMGWHDSPNKLAMAVKDQTPAGAALFDCSHHSNIDGTLHVK